MQIKITFKAIFLVEGGGEYGVEVGSCAKRSLKFKGEEISRGNPRALNSQWRWQILTKSTFCWRGVVPLFARSSPALLSAEEGKV